MPPSTQRRTALITGASSGIGYELAVLFAKRGCNVILVARSELKLANLALELQTQYNIEATPLVRDLSLPNGAVELFDTLQAAGRDVDYLVNNAGFGAFGHFTETDWMEEHKMIEVNIVFLTQMTKLFAGSMVKRRFGKILNVASTAAFQPGPLMAVYYATKAYVLSLSEAVANELHGTGVSVSCLCPGPTETEFHERANITPAKIASRNILMDVSKVARIGYKGMLRNKRVIIPGIRNKMLVQALRFLPRKVVVAAIRRFQEYRKRLR